MLTSNCVALKHLSFFDLWPPSTTSSYLHIVANLLSSFVYLRCCPHYLISCSKGSAHFSFSFTCFTCNLVLIGKGRCFVVTILDCSCLCSQPNQYLVKSTVECIENAAAFYLRCLSQHVALLTASSTIFFVYLEAQVSSNKLYSFKHPVTSLAVGQYFTCPAVCSSVQKSPAIVEEKSAGYKKNYRVQKLRRCLDFLQEYGGFWHLNARI